MRQAQAIDIIFPQIEEIMKLKNGINKICKACGKEFYVPNYRKDTAKFCSLQCQNHTQYNRFIFTCKECGKKCDASPSRKNYKKKFCSIECMVKKSKNEKERRQIIKSVNTINKRYLKQNRSLRRHVFKLKDKKCSMCGYSEYEFCLDIHHIDFNSNNNSIENLDILCCLCHRILHWEKKAK